jgi:small conductance mechanosensitive channel
METIGIDPQTEKMIADVVKSFTDYGLNILGAVALLIVGWTAANWARRLVARGLARVPWMDQTLKPFLAKLAWYTVIIFVLVAVLNQFGVHTTSIIALLGAAGIAIGLALQGTLANVAAGVMLLVLRPFNVGDYVDAGGDAGTVIEIGLFITELRTFDGLCRMVPNSKIWTNTITNFTRNPSRRLDIPVGISYGDDISGAQQVLMNVLQGDQRILTDPKPQVMVMELGDSAVVLNIRCWTKGDDYWATVFDLNKAAKIGLESAGYSIPFPQRDVHIIGGGSAPGQKA